MGDSPKLEMISRHPAAAARSVPLLFVHGAFAGAWCWDDHFLPFFAERGFDVHALSLRGHGRSQGGEGWRFHSLRDYAADVAWAVKALGRPPVLVGHSMGGLVIQAYLERYRARLGAAGLVLMASVPPQGIGGPMWELSWKDPWLAQRLMLAQTVSRDWLTPATVGRALFTPAVPERVLERCCRRVHAESWRVMADMLAWDLPSPDVDGLPRLVMGGGFDRLIPAHYVHATAGALATEAQIFPMGHAMMLETNWHEPARCLLEWLDAQGL